MMSANQWKTVTCFWNIYHKVPDQELTAHLSIAIDASFILQHAPCTTAGDYYTRHMRYNQHKRAAIPPVHIPVELKLAQYINDTLVSMLVNDVGSLFRSHQRVPIISRFTDWLGWLGCVWKCLFWSKRYYLFVPFLIWIKVRRSKKNP